MNQPRYRGFARYPHARVLVISVFRSLVLPILMFFQREAFLQVHATYTRNQHH